MTISLRAVPLILVFLPVLAGAWLPPVSAAQTTPDTPQTTQRSVAEDESLRALQQDDDSLRAEPEETRASTFEQASETVQSLGLRAFWAVMVLLITYFATRGIEFALAPLTERSTRPLFFKRLRPLLHVLLWTVAIYVVLHSIFHVTAEGLLAIAVVAGLAVGLAAQDVLKNILSGLVIVFDPPFRTGDTVSIADTYGKVTTVGLRATRIMTPDDNLVSVPNAQVVNEQVTNANASALSRQVVTDLYLPGEVDEARAKEMAYTAAASSMYVNLKKPIVVHVRDAFKETFLTHLKVKAHVFDARYEALLMSDITERARRAFREQGLLPSTPGTDVREGVSPMSHAEENGQSLSD